MGISKKDLLKEVMGVPRAISMWVNLLTDLNIENIQNVGNMGGWEESFATDTESGEQIKILRNRITKTKTNEYIKNFFGVTSNGDLLDNEEFQKLPLWNPKIITQVTVVPDEFFDSFTEGGQEASFGVDGDQKELTKIGGYEVLSKIFFLLNVFVAAGDMDKGNFERVIKLSKPTIAHELTHAFQKFKMYKNKVGGDFGKEGVLNTVLNHERSGNVGIRTNEWSELTYLIYTHLSFEVNARVTQLYYDLKGTHLKTKEDIVRSIKENPLWGIMENLKNFNSKKFIKNHMEIDSDFKSMFAISQAFRGEIPANIENKVDLLKHFIKKWDEEIKEYAEWSEKNDRPIPTMASVPKKAKEDPMVFLKFWEKRFHKKGEEYRRKLLRVGQLLLNDINEIK